MVKVGTFNLNNLFSRFNFRAEIDTAPDDFPGGISFTFENDDVKVRTFMGRLIRAKDKKDRDKVARRIIEMDVDVLAVQEVEHIGILKEFNRDSLKGLYPHVVLIEGNDRRLIDVGILSKFPIGKITTHQTAVHPEEPNKRVFSRDLLQAEILDEDRNPLFTLYNTHLKSHYVPYGTDPVAGGIAADSRRRRQTETIARIIEEEGGPGDRYVLAGDMNDPSDSPHLAPMISIGGAPLTNALNNPVETRQPRPETTGQGPGPLTPAWTHRFNPPGPEPPEYALYDQIWLSPLLTDRFSNPKIDRRTRHGGDGSDHDPAWIELDL